METAFYIAGAVAIISTVLYHHPAQCRACVALSGCLAPGRGRGFLYHGRTAGGCAGSDHLRGRDHGSFCFCSDDAEPGKARRRKRTAIDAGKDLGGSIRSFRSPDCRGGVFDRTRGVDRSAVWIAARRRKRRAGSETGGDGTLWALPDWRGTGFHVAAGRPGGSFPPGPACIRESGGS